MIFLEAFYFVTVYAMPSVVVVDICSGNTLYAKPHSRKIQFC